VLDHIPNPTADASDANLLEVSKQPAERVPVLVTTLHRGVFFGYADPAQVQAKEKITLTQCRNCIHWERVVGGFLGLAATGPSLNCRIGAVAPEVVLHDITSVSLCTAEAAVAWTR
jgi:hypothetical protein